ncbi:hypothetical protein [Halosegnis sp.]|uniref:hypothetical protein n=1 Tax=Halosegnis sp. TaxID=2864959 RepID=UPI0035D4375C
MYAGGDPVARLREWQTVSRDHFDAQVREEAAVLKEELAAGTFDNPGTTLGLEYELYGVDRGDAQLRRLPRSLLGYRRVMPELGLHNAELNSCPQPCNDFGLRALSRGAAAAYRRVGRAAAAEDIRLVSDGLWTVPPADRTAHEYLTAATEAEGLTLGVNVTNKARYHGFANTDRGIGGHLDVPGVSLEADYPAFVALTTSIQPHYQCRSAADLPSQFGYALRVAGPLLALAANSPVLPADLYDGTPDRAVLLEEGWAEHRVPIYEQVINGGNGPGKVRFPDDIDSAAAAVDAIVEDTTLVPANPDREGRFDDAFAHLCHKHGSYWRWIRPVFEGATEGDANVRIEFRPLPAQPTVPDTVALVAALAGLLTELHAQQHPVADLSWDRARENFYAAARDGLEANLEWITTTGDRTTDSERLFEDLLTAATDGLERHGVAPTRAAAWLAPLRARVTAGRTPAGWKRGAIAARLDAGADPAAAIRDTQRRYVDRQTETLFGGALTDWPAPAPVAVDA